jgi:hypothetical protein
MDNKYSIIFLIIFLFICFHYTDNIEKNENFTSNQTYNIEGKLKTPIKINAKDMNKIFQAINNLQMKANRKDNNPNFYQNNMNNLMNNLGNGGAVNTVTSTTGINSNNLDMINNQSNWNYNPSNNIPINPTFNVYQSQQQPMQQPMQQQTQYAHPTSYQMMRNGYYDNMNKNNNNNNMNMNMKNSQFNPLSPPFKQIQQQRTQHMNTYHTGPMHNLPQSKYGQVETVTSETLPFSYYESPLGGSKNVLGYAPF